MLVDYFRSFRVDFVLFYSLKNMRLDPCDFEEVLVDMLV